MNKHLLTTAAILGFIVPYFALGLFVLENGLNVPLLLHQVFASYGSVFFALDVILCALFVIYLCIKNTSLGNKRYLVIAATILIGPSCSLPLYYRLSLQD